MKVPDGATVSGTAPRRRAEIAAGAIKNRSAPRLSPIQPSRKAVERFLRKAAVPIRSQNEDRSLHLVAAKNGGPEQIAGAVQRHAIRECSIAFPLEVVNHRFSPCVSRPRHLVDGAAGLVVGTYKPGVPSRVRGAINVPRARS